MSALDDGMIWLSTPRFTVGLIVRAGRVVDCPPIARSWAYGRLAYGVWARAARRRDTRLAWYD